MFRLWFCTSGTASLWLSFVTYRSISFSESSSSVRRNKFWITSGEEKREPHTQNTFILHDGQNVLQMSPLDSVETHCGAGGLHDFLRMRWICPRQKCHPWTLREREREREFHPTHSRFSSLSSLLLSSLLFSSLLSSLLFSSLPPPVAIPLRISHAAAKAALLPWPNAQWQ